MGIAENQYFASLYILTETLKVNLILSVFQVERRVNHFALHALRHQEEGMINGSHHHYPVAGIGEALQCEGLTADNAGYKSQHLASDVPTVATTEPATNGSIPFLTRRRIAQHFMFKTLPQGFHHKRGRAEIHIRHPHGEEVIASPYTLHTVPFHGVGTTALYYFIKIVSHMLAFYNSTHQFVLFLYDPLPPPYFCKQ